MFENNQRIPDVVIRAPGARRTSGLAGDPAARGLAGGREGGFLPRFPKETETKKAELPHGAALFFGACISSSSGKY